MLGIDELSAFLLPASLHRSYSSSLDSPRERLPRRVLEENASWMVLYFSPIWYSGPDSFLGIRIKISLTKERSQETSWLDRPWRQTPQFFWFLLFKGWALKRRNQKMWGVCLQGLSVSWRLETVYNRPNLFPHSISLQVSLSVGKGGQFCTFLLKCIQGSSELNNQERPCWYEYSMRLCRYITTQPKK